MVKAQKPKKDALDSNIEHLNYLTYNVLARRKAKLFEIAKDKSIPEPIKQMFLKKQMTLIKSVINDIIKTKKQIIKTNNRKRKIATPATI